MHVSCLVQVGLITTLLCRQELAAAIATDGLLPLTKDDTPASFAAMLKACWSLEPADRPSAQEMLQSLQAMQAEAWAHDAYQQPDTQPCLEAGDLHFLSCSHYIQKHVSKEILLLYGTCWYPSQNNRTW